MNRWILGLVACASSLVAPGSAGAQEATADGDAAVKEASRPDDPGKAEITFVFHGYDGVIGALGFGPLKAEFEKRGYSCKIVRSPKTKTPNQDRAKAMVEALKDVEGDIVLVGISNQGMFMPLVAAERPIRRIVMINAVVPWPGKSFREAFDFEEVFATEITRDLAERPRHVGGLPAQGIAEGRVCLRLRRKGRRDTAGMGAVGRARVSARRAGGRQRRGPREYPIVRERGRRRRDKGTLTNSFVGWALPTRRVVASQFCLALNGTWSHRWTPQPRLITGLTVRA